ncbi:ubiquitin-like protein Pup [Actinopolyspora biskrensis]|uniref:Prokaryotic ubiquitin-like protein Pup n=1 Tax=Actinopolyspora biskrensis TaxID=1470178 RepID=A0A852YRF2_9ACTN|nr:ubiquitin-like protein Pup [Actinopolyspora biskrensis]NYH77814.1 ubiquitin-like protein Pup [Actinopolyspora biskrensis]
MQQERPSRNDHGDSSEENDENGQQTGSQRREQLADDTETTLDEIDDVLEEDAEQFVRSYVQKGGQ